MSSHTDSVSDYETGYIEPTLDQATHILDGVEPVTRTRPATEIWNEIEQSDAISGERRKTLYPRIDRARAAEHGLFLVHTIPAHKDDFNGELLVTGDRLTEITNATSTAG